MLDIVITKKDLKQIDVTLADLQLEKLKEI